MPSHQHSQPRPQAPSVGLSQSSSTKRMSCRCGIDADGGERLQIEVLQVRRRRLQDHLELVIVLQPVGIFAVAAILRPPRRLHIGGVPGFRPERAQRGRRMKGARAHFHVVGLQDHAALIRPVTAAAPGSSPGTSVPGACAEAGNPSSIRSLLKGAASARDRIGGGTGNQGNGRPDSARKYRRSQQLHRLGRCTANQPRNVVSIWSAALAIEGLSRPDFTGAEPLWPW